MRTSGSGGSRGAGQLGVCTRCLSWIVVTHCPWLMSFSFGQFGASFRLLEPCPLAGTAGSFFSSSIVFIRLSMMLSPLRNKFNKHKTTQNWIAYKSQRDKCTSIRRENIRNHFSHLCTTNVAPPKKFWESVNPIQARGVFRDPQRFLSITFRMFEIILWNLMTFPEIYWEIRWH